MVFGPKAQRLDIFDMKGSKVFEALKEGETRLRWDGRGLDGRPAASGSYLAVITDAAGRRHRQIVAVAR